MENRQFEAMLAVAQERLAQHAPEDIAGKAGAQYADGSFSLKILGQTVTVRLSDCTIQPPLSKWHALTLLHYLDLADGAPLTGRTITFSQYKDGLVRGGGLVYYKVIMRKGIRYFKGIFHPETKAILGNDSAATKGSSITFGTSNTTFTIFRCNSGAWRITKEFTGDGAEANCIAWCDTKLGKSATGGG